MSKPVLRRLSQAVAMQITLYQPPDAGVQPPATREVAKLPSGWAVSSYYLGLCDGI